MELSEDVVELLARDRREGGPRASTESLALPENRDRPPIPRPREDLEDLAPEPRGKAMVALPDHPLGVPVQTKNETAPRRDPENDEREPHDDDESHFFSGRMPRRGRGPRPFRYLSEAPERPENPGSPSAVEHRRAGEGTLVRLRRCGTLGCGSAGAMRRELLAKGSRTRVDLVTVGSERWVEKSLLGFADVGPERRRLAREAWFGRVIDDPAIAETLDDIEDEAELSSFRRRYVEGLTLAEARSRDGLDPEDVLRRALEVVARLHERSDFGGFIHGDLTLTNLYLLPDGSLRIADLELSRFSDEAPREDGGRGTPSMLAPEVRDGGLPTQASDVYQLGLLYLRLRGLGTSAAQGTPWALALAERPEIRPTARELLGELFPAKAKPGPLRTGI